MEDRSNFLGFTPAWFARGVVSAAQVKEMEMEYEIGDDKNTEHFRYGAFRRFVASHRPLPPETIRALYDLGNHDANPGMGGAIMADLILLQECPPDVLEDAARSSRQHLPRLAAKRQGAVSRAKFEAALAQIPDREPEPYDAL